MGEERFNFGQSNVNESITGKDYLGESHTNLRSGHTQEEEKGVKKKSMAQRADSQRRLEGETINLNYNPRSRRGADVSGNRISLRDQRVGGS